MNSNKNGKIMFGVVIIAILLIIIVGITYAFFNYTRTGTNNIIKTGKIYFNSEQDSSINLTNMFPIDVSEGIPNDNTKVGSVTINVVGDTTYNDGVEYLISASNVYNSVGNKNLPISIDISYSANGNGKVIGTSDDDYFTNRGGEGSIYKILANDTIANDDKLLIGYIAKGQTGIDGNIVIRAYLDKEKIAISDTYPEGDVTHTEGEEPNQEEVIDYTNGTNDTWVGDREIFTTSEWNSLQANGVSFQVKVEANEGIWVEEPFVSAAEYISSTGDLVEVAGIKRYVGINPENYVTFNGEQWRIIGVYGDSLKIIKNTQLASGKAYNSNGLTSWENSELKSYLNQETEGGYYYTLDNTAKEMIASGTWLSGAASRTDTAEQSYTKAQQISVTAKVGLIAAYEYLYSADNTCWTTSGYSYNNSCASNDWLNSIFAGMVASLTPNDDETHQNHPGVLTIFKNAGGFIDVSVMGYPMYNIFPVVYLKPNVTISGGDGASPGTAYTLSYHSS